MQGRRIRESEKIINVSPSGKRAKNVKDHFSSIPNKRRFIVFLVCFGIIVLITGIGFASSLKTLGELSDQKSLLMDQKEDLEMTSEMLKEEAEFTTTREFVEYMARKLLGWINPNDKKYVIVD
ncbi:MAG: hypothetical protein JXN65_03325 [Clostridia bacterium]|nr:hypothetical protein [Clostridia bacterium]